MTCECSADLTPQTTLSSVILLVKTVKYNVLCNYRYGFSIILQQKGITQDFLFSYAQPEAQSPIASSQDSNASLAVNHWINNIFFHGGAFLRWLFGVFESSRLKQRGDGGNSYYEGEQLWKEWLSKTLSILLKLLANLWTSACFKCSNV